MESKGMRDSHTVMCDIVFPPETNHYGSMFGGRVTAYMDRVASIAAMRHCRRSVVTAAIERIDFLSPIALGDAIVLEAMVVFVGRTSMVVHIRVESENLLSGERRHTASAFFTFVALDQSGHPTPVPPVHAESEGDRALAEAWLKSKSGTAPGGQA